MYIRMCVWYIHRLVSILDWLPFSSASYLFYIYYDYVIMFIIPVRICDYSSLAHISSDVSASNFFYVLNYSMHKCNYSSLALISSDASASLEPSIQVQASSSPRQRHADGGGGRRGCVPRQLRGVCLLTVPLRLRGGGGGRNCRHSSNSTNTEVLTYIRTYQLDQH